MLIARFLTHVKNNLSNCAMGVIRINEHTMLQILVYVVFSHIYDFVLLVFCDDSEGQLGMHFNAF